MDERYNDIEDVKRRVKKLLALSKSPNENEAISALEKANALMKKYNLRTFGVNDYTKKSIKSTKRPVIWRSVLANAVEKIYATYHYLQRDTGVFVFIGEELDVFMATEMFIYLVKTVNRMTQQNIRKNAKSKYRRSYREGLAFGLVQRMEELGQSCSWRDPKELTKKRTEIAQWVKQESPITEHSLKQVRRNSTAMKRGMFDADKINLGRQMTGSGDRMISDR